MPLCPTDSAGSELLYCCLTHPLCATTSGRFSFTMVMKLQVMVQKVACRCWASSRKSYLKVRVVKEDNKN